ncbi:MAG: hypothetical protein K0S33_1727 [Bacteroidetes bacterium]|jgi:hypothetical protein|nr:hypothetical protein [Bacteroidota bacterium]
MENQTIKADTAFTQQIIKQVLVSWTSRNTAVTSFFNKYADDAYLNEIAPGRNRAAFLLGHLIATNDALLPLLGLREKLFPELENFSGNPDKSFANLPAMTELKQKWETVNSTLSDHFSRMSAEEWMDRHTAVSEADFELEPQRNKLNVLIGRTNHQSYHLGQLNLLKVKEVVV